MKSQTKNVARMEDVPKALALIVRKHLSYWAPPPRPPDRALGRVAQTTATAIARIASTVFYKSVIFFK